MLSSKTSKRALRFVIFSLIIGAIAAFIKIVLTYLGVTRLYALPIIGGFLQSLELVELSNFVVFPMLGFGIGIATVLLPQRLRQRVGALMLLGLTPLILSTSYITRHHLWVEQVANQTNIPADQAQDVTNTFLEAKANHAGLWGYYLYTASVPLLPHEAAEMQQLDESEERVRNELNYFSGLESDALERLFDAVGWGIRGFYILVSLLLVSVYFYKGFDRANRPVAPRQAAKVSS